MNYSFDSIAGYTQEKEELKRLCEIFNNRAKYEEKGAKLPKGIIFYGSAGTGKTLFAKVMASVCGLEVFKIDLGEVENESAKAVISKNENLIKKLIPILTEKKMLDKKKCEPILAELGGIQR